MNPETDVFNVLRQRPLVELAALPIAEVYRLFQQLAVVKEQARQAESMLQTVMNRRYGECAQKLRQQMGKDTGLVHFDDGPVRITADLPKRVEWDQATLADIVRRIQADGDDPAEFVEVAYKVSETKYHAWPAAMQAVFAPARTLKPGKAGFRLALVTPEGA